MRHIDRFFETTNRLRTEGTDHLLAAARAVGASRFVAQSFAGWPAARTGGPVQGRGRSVRSGPTRAAPRHAGRDPPPRGGSDTGGLARGRRAPLRRVLRPRHHPQRRPLRRPQCGRPQAPVPRRRGRRRDLVLHSRRRRGGGDRGRGRPRQARASTTWWTTIPRRRATGCPSWRARWARSRRGASRFGWVGSSPGRRPPS